MQPKIFVACPIGSDDSAERIRSDKLLKHIIAPVVKEVFSVAPEDVIVRFDKIGEPGRITTQILRELTESTVVIADLTGTNPNVMYEVGIRQATLKPFVLLAEKGQRLPFDLNDFRTVFYQLDLDHVDEAQNELKLHLSKVMASSASSVDEALFGKRGEVVGRADDDASRGLLAVVEVCESILKETITTKELVTSVGTIVLGLREEKDDKEEQARIRKEQSEKEMGMFMMSQFMQNPEGAEKILPMIQRLSEMNAAQNTGITDSSSPNAAIRKKRRP